jgi:hypothetical protein
VRTALTVLGISVGLGLIVALVAIADGYVAQFGSMATRSGSDLTVMQADVADMAFSALDEDVGKKIASIPGVAPVATTGPGGTNFTLTLGLDQPPAGLRWGMTSTIELLPAAGP